MSSARKLPRSVDTPKVDCSPVQERSCASRKFSESQIVEILKDAEGGVPVADLLRKHGVSKATFFKWRSKYGGATISDVKRLRELEAENTKLKRMYADLALENAAIKDVLNRKL